MGRQSNIWSHLSKNKGLIDVFPGGITQPIQIRCIDFIRCRRGGGLREGLTVNKALEEQEEEVTSSPNTAHVKHQVFFPRVFGCLLSKNRGLLHIVRIYNDVSRIYDALEQGPTASETINLQLTI